MVSAPSILLLSLHLDHSTQAEAAKLILRAAPTLPLCLTRKNKNRQVGIGLIGREQVGVGRGNSGGSRGPRPVDEVLEFLRKTSCT